MRRIKSGLLQVSGTLFALVLTGQAQTKATSPTPPTPSTDVTYIASSKPAKKPTAHHKSSRSRHSARSTKHGQQKIDASRTRDIQQALIEQHYMQGKPSGKWDATTQKAMERYQADNGWQTKVFPDSRALIKLGLGPDHEHLLNPETAMTAMPVSSRATSSSSSAAAPTQTEQ